MNLRSIVTIMRKDGQDVWRNKTMLTLLLTPLVIGLLYVVTSLATQGEPTRVLAYNPDGLPITTTLQTDERERFEVRAAATISEVRTTLAAEESEYDYGVVLPAGAGVGIRSGNAPLVTLYINAGRIEDQAQQRAVQNRFAGYLGTLGRVPYHFEGAVVNQPTTDERANFLRRIAPNAVETFLGGVTIILVPLIIAFNLTGYLIVEEKERRTIRLLTASVRPREIVLAKFAVASLYSLLIGLLIVAINLANISNPLAVVGYLLLGTLVFSGMGVLAAALTNDCTSFNAWCGFAGFIFLAPVILSAPFIKEVPVISQLFHLLPSYYLSQATIGSALGTLTWGDGLIHAAVLTGMALLAGGLAVVALRRRRLTAV